MRLGIIKQDAHRRIALICGATDVVVDLVEAAERREGLSDLARHTPNDLTTIIKSPQLYSSIAELAVQLEREGTLASNWVDRKDVLFAAPIERPGKIICLAGNYREHIAESGFVVPQHSAVLIPQLFLKPATTLVGDGDDIALRENNERVGWEVELAVVIGRGGRNIAVSDANQHIFGYTILNDISERKLNSKIPGRSENERDKFFDWLAGKWFDSFAPCGPWVVTKDEIDDPHNLEIKLYVNGEIRQQGNTGEMIHRIPETIAYASSVMTLEPGDILSTGTPVGAGIGGASTSLSDGDEVVCEVSGIGTLRNRVRYAS